MGIKRVWIEQGCLGCGMAQATCPEVFVLSPDTEVNELREGVTDLGPFEAQIREAAGQCPAEVIKLEEG